MDSRGYPFLINIETKSKKLNDDATLKKLFNKILDNSSFTVVGFLDKNLKEVEEVYFFFLNLICPIILIQRMVI